MEDFKSFLNKNWGGLLGGIIALILACTNLYRIIIGILLIIAGVWIGNYLQHNKEKAKENMKDLIDKM